MLEQANDSGLEPEKIYQLIGGALCLDFCNTVGGKRGVVARESLHSYRHLLSWSQQVGILSAEEVKQLKGKAAERPAEAAEVLADGIGLREALYRIFLGLGQGKQPASKDIEVLNLQLARSLGRLRIGGGSETGFHWKWSSGEVALDQPLGPVAYSAAKLMVSESELGHVHQCRGDNCGWLFLDSSKNHSRCWCDMRDCGNRAKVRRHRQKQQGS